MSDFGKIAEKFAARRGTFATPTARPKDAIDRSWECLSRYPTVTLLCVAVIVGIVAIAVAFLVHFVDP